MFAIYRNYFCFVLVKWTKDIGIDVLSSITLLSNNLVVVCGDDAKGTTIVKCYDIRTGSELHCAELKRYAGGIAEVKHADTLSLAMSFP